MRGVPITPLSVVGPTTVRGDAACRGAGGTRARTASRSTGPAETFSSQADAESWIGQTWRELAGVRRHPVVLVEDDRVEYRMSLLPPAE